MKKKKLYNDFQVEFKDEEKKTKYIFNNYEEKKIKIKRLLPIFSVQYRHWIMNKKKLVEQ